MQAVENYGILRGLVLAAWRLLRCNPLSRGGVDPVHEQRLFKTRGHGGERLIMLIDANIFQPLIDVFEAVIKFFHNSVGVPWGWSIVLLTVAVRALLIPLTVKQFGSMQRMQQLRPQMKEIQKKYKEDKERQQQEMMRFYKENNVNPLGSCLPLVAQIPVFISLFYMLRTSLRIDICRAHQPPDPRRDRQGPPAPLRRRPRRRLPVHPGPDQQGHRRCPGRPDRPLRRHPARPRA